MINIVHFQTGITSSGSSVNRLHRLMLMNELNSTILCATSTDSGKGIRAFSGLKLKLYALKNTIEKSKMKSVKVKSFNRAKHGFKFSNSEVVKNADVIYLHWTQGGLLSLSELKRIFKLGKPVVLSFRDSWYMTGGCHVPLDCDKYFNGCNNCPCLRERADNDLSFLLYEHKMKLYNNFKNIFLLAPSEWIKQSILQTKILQNKPIYQIGNALDTNIYSRRSKENIRLKLGLNTKKTYLLFGSVSPTSNLNKGWNYLVDALNIYSKNYSTDFELLVFGSEYEPDFEKNFNCKVNFLGKVDNEERLAEFYSASDIFLTPSLSESFGNTVIEAGSCGVPVVAFKIGGIKDTIDHKKNGYLARFKDTTDFAFGIFYCLQNNLTGYLKEEFNPNVIIQKHLAMIAEIRSVKI